MNSPTDLFRAWTAARIQERRLSHAQLAVRCGIDRSTVTRLLRGERRPTLEIAVGIISTLDDESTPATFSRVLDVADPPRCVEAALRADPRLDVEKVDALMRHYRELRAGRRQQRCRDNGHHRRGVASTLRIPR